MRKPCYLFLLIIFLNISCSSDDDNHTNNETVSDAFFMLNNLNDENQLIYFNRNLNSKLEIVGSYGTKGSGGNLDPFREFGVTADPNGSQGSVNFAQNNKFVLNVNNFDSSFSVFKIHPEKLEFITKQNTDFEYPNSITSAKNVVYILHLFGGLQGFKIDKNGQLNPIPNAKYQFDSSAIGYVNVSINDSATKLIVTTLSDKAYIISLDENGEFTSIEENDALRPFGSIFITEDVVAITRARLGSVGIYRINENNKLILLSEENTEVRGLCWFKTDRLKNYLYGSNTPEGKIFKFNIQNFTQEVSLVAESTPPPSRNTVIQGEDTIRYYIFLDLVVTDHFVYVIDPLNERIDSYKIETNGSLTYDTNTSFKDRPIINTISGGFNGFSN